MDIRAEVGSFSSNRRTTWWRRLARWAGLLAVVTAIFAQVGPPEAAATPFEQAVFAAAQHANGSHSRGPAVAVHACAQHGQCSIHAMLSPIASATVGLVGSMGVQPATERFFGDLIISPPSPPPKVIAPL